MKLSLQTATEQFKNKFKESAKVTAEASKYLPGGYSRASENLEYSGGLKDFSLILPKGSR